MTTEVGVLRSKWRRVRRQLSLVDPKDESFACADLGGRVGHLHVRLMVLPSDPEGVNYDFDDDFWDSLRSSIPQSDGRAPFGTNVSATAWGAAYTYADGSDALDTYLALRRNGALDAGLGNSMTFSVGTQVYLRLLAVVGRVRLALDRYRLWIERFGIGGPFEVSLALVGVAGSALGNFASGWARGADVASGRLTAEENAYLNHWEVDSFSEENDTRELTDRIGRWIENCWGSQLRRFVAVSAGSAGDIDWREFR